MGDAEDHTARQPTETLRGGPSRPPFFHRVPRRWRQRALAPLAFALGIASGAGTVLWWQTGPEPVPRPHRVDEHAVELVLFQAVPPPTDPRGRASEIRLLQVDGALLLSGVVTSTVLGIDDPNPGLDVRVPALPVTVSPATRFQAVDLEILVRDCEVATRWAPADRPFTITWRDEFGKEHMDSAGDFGGFMADALVRSIDAMCEDR